MTFNTMKPKKTNTHTHKHTHQKSENKEYVAAGLAPEVDDRCLTDKAIAADNTCTITTTTAGAVSGAWS